MKRKNLSSEVSGSGLFPETLQVYLIALKETAHAVVNGDGAHGPLLRLEHRGDFYGLEIIAPDVVRLGVLLPAAAVGDVDSVAMLVVATTVMATTPFVRVFMLPQGGGIAFLAEGIVTSSEHLIRCVDAWLGALGAAKSMFSEALAAVAEPPATERRNRRTKRADGGAETASVPGDICRVRVRLLDVKPSVWRRLEVPLNTTFAKFHRVLQAALGWDNTHLHLFRVNGREIGMPVRDGLGVPCEDERRVRLADVARPKCKIVYWYDFGDDWMHEITIETIAAAAPSEHYPRLTGGANSVPPEDAGGPPGWADLREALADPAHPQHDDFRKWFVNADRREYDEVELADAIRKVR